MKKFSLLLVALFVIAGALVTVAQDEPVDAPAEDAEAKAPFHLRMVGEWTWTSEARTSPEAEPMTSSGTSTCRAVGELWAITDVLGKMGEMEFHGVMTLGQNPEGAITGTWISSMDPTMWTYTGELDESGNALTLSAEGPDMTDPEKTRDYKDVWTFSDDDNTLTMESFAKDDDGNWQSYMKMDIKRKK